MTESASPRSAYVHVPFCRHRCGYCNFTLVAGRDDLIESYLQALRLELEATVVRPRNVDTIFLGGGTPTHLSPSELRSLLELVNGWFSLATDGEFSVEANPVDVTAEHAHILGEAGVTRVSLGVQSFSDRKLQLLERDHDEKIVATAAEIILKRQFELAIDLIFAVPDETLDEWREDIRRALSLTPVHLSTYGLTFERGTRFWSALQRGGLQAVGDESEREMYLTAIDHLTSAGFEHYEVSNFAVPDHRCRHNQVYWTGGEFFGIGPGAASLSNGVRVVNHRSTTTYLKRVLNGESPIAESESLSAIDRARERLVFGLRRLGGVDVDVLARECGVALDQLRPEAISRLEQMGMLKVDGSHVHLTRQGLLVSDSIWPELL